MLTRDFEALVERVYRLVLRNGDTAIDVGAHIGRHTISMGEAVGPTGHVWAFEPLDECRRSLTTSLSEIGMTWVRVRAEALSDETGLVSYVVVHGSPEYSGLRPRQYDIEVETDEATVPAVRLDDLLESLSEVRFIKVDTEGAEYKILRGAQSLIDRDRPVITFEFGDNSLTHYEHNSADMAHLLSDHEYRILSIDGAELGQDAFIKSSATQQVWDYVGIPREQTDRFNAVCSILRTAEPT